MVERLRKALEQYWGYTEFRPLQKEAMECLCTGRDAVVVLPTGGGKSLCFQAPAVTTPGLAVVVSPLISLMKDQVDALTECGVPAARIDSSLTPEEREAALDRVRRRQLKLLYISPERLVSDGFSKFLQTLDLSFIAIDEAHCISFWGHDFRPEYRQLGSLRQIFPKVAIGAYTATATEQVRRDIAEQLRLKDPAMLVGSFDRPNLIYKVRPRSRVVKQVCEVLDRYKGESGIIYCIRRRDVDDMAEKLTAKGYRVAPYHAGMTDEARKKNQDDFVAEKIDTIIATVAFGMGIDKSNVRYVIHAGMPKSLEHYQQESGRAGRDGLEAECWLFYSGGDYGVWKSILMDSRGEGVPPSTRGPEARSSGIGFQPMNHRQDADATVHGQDSRVTDAPASLVIRQGARLPHWTQGGATYNVAFRLANSLPANVLEAWELEREKIGANARAQKRALTEHEEEQLSRLYSEKVEKYLDAGHGECWLKDPRIAAIVRDVLRHFDGSRYDVLAWCVMPNHVHVVVHPRAGYDLSGILHSWKSFLANRINEALGRTGAVWQAESYDHLIRGEEDFRHTVAYVLDNPRMAGLQNWPWCGIGFQPMNHRQDADATVRGEEAPATSPSATEIALAKLARMHRYCTDAVCRRRTILEYFGQAYPQDNCGTCDICLGDVDLASDALVTSQKILSCILRLGQRFGGGYTALVLTGSRDQRILDNRHDALSTYGLLQDYDKRTVHDWIEQLAGQGFVEKTGEYNVLSVTEKGWRVIREDVTPRLLKPAEKAGKPERKTKVEAQSWEGVDKGLFEALRRLRAALASERHVPAYIIFSDAALRDMARRRPSTLQRFLSVRGVGETKCEQYGRVMVEKIRAYCLEHALEMDR